MPTDKKVATRDHEKNSRWHRRVPTLLAVVLPAKIISSQLQREVFHQVEIAALRQSARVQRALCDQD